MRPSLVRALLLLAPVPGLGVRPPLPTGCWLRPGARLARASPISCKGVAGFRFSLDMWYGEDNFVGTDVEEVPQVWVSPWAEAHFKLRQQEIEIERCQMLLNHSIEVEDYAEAGGLQERVARLRSQHPLIPREERIESALADGNFELAAIFQKDLDAIKASLGLPRFAVGQTVKHAHRGLRGVVLDVDLVCTRTEEWVLACGSLERGIAMGYPADQCDPAVIGAGKMEKWRAQPFYVVLPDLRDMHTTPKALACWEVNEGQAPAPFYLSEDALEHFREDCELDNPGVSKLFDGYEAMPHRGRVYKPASRLRLWQQQQAEEKSKRERAKRFKRIGLNDGTYFLS